MALIPADSSTDSTGYQAGPSGRRVTYNTSTKVPAHSVAIWANRPAFCGLFMACLQWCSRGWESLPC